MRLKKRFYISWVGLRGAVPIVFATYPLLAGIEKANMIFNIVFLISVTSVLIQGTTIPLVAKWLNVALPEKEKPVCKIEGFTADIPKSILQEIEISSNFYAVNKRIVDLSFPKSAFIIMIKRNNQYIRPGGSTVIEAKDTLMILADDQQDFAKVNESINKQFYPQKS